MKIVRALARTGVAVSAIITGGAAVAQSGDVNVYTYRESKLIQPLLEAFTKDTGIKVNVISASSGLEQRIKTEGVNSPADILLTVDIGRLEEAVRSGITQPIKSELLDKGRSSAIPRSGGALVRRFDARAGGLCLEGSRAADHSHI